ncbi:hypothetical protein L210DRAFT_3500255 [Boletus edulis BED1]|uniref:Uncharacterized protein n=1 Tax=Boletus edulis BED1 TaxID=1328754 RepID=A0AAD4C769_BOLED|nr:hypothetical protein L210DRAFT_3500255 [Boletus edulis BED1]
MVDEEKLEQLHEHDHLNLRSSLELNHKVIDSVNNRQHGHQLPDPKQPAFPQTLSDSRPYLNLTIGHHRNSVLAHAGFTTRVMDVGPACPNRNLFAPGSELLLVVMSNGVVEETQNFNDECDCLPSGNSATLVINGVEVDTFMLSTVAQCAGTPTSYHSSQDNVEG